MQTTVTGAGKDPQGKKTEKAGHSASRLPYSPTAPTLPGMPKIAHFAQVNQANVDSQPISALAVVTHF
jgi:hypothetical protein